MLRIILFLATNLAVMVLLTIVVKVTGLDRLCVQPQWHQPAGLADHGSRDGHGRLVHIAGDVEVDRQASVGAQVIAEPRNPTENVAFRRPCAITPKRPASACPKSRSTTRPK